MNKCAKIIDTEKEFIQKSLNCLLQMLTSGKLEMAIATFDLEIESYARQAQILRVYKDHNLFKKIVCARNAFVRIDARNIVLPRLNAFLKDLYSVVRKKVFYCDTSFLVQERVTLRIYRKAAKCNKAMLSKLSHVDIKHMHLFDESLRRYLLSNNSKKKTNQIKTLQKIGQSLLNSGVITPELLIESIIKSQRKNIKLFCLEARTTELKSYREYLRQLTKTSTIVCLTSQKVAA